MRTGVDILMQNNGLSDSGDDGHGLCAGVMAIRSTPATRDIFDLRAVPVERAWDEQRHLGRWLSAGSVRVGAMPLPLFPNGQYFARHLAPDAAAPPGGRPAAAAAPLLVHFNLLGDDKRAAMRAFGRWELLDGRAGELQPAAKFA